MGKVIVLDKKLANQIAAGEVVERPASVVKELVENSLDAGATDITVEIENGGIDSIIITDNGEGMSKEDLEIVTDKYTTSKISSIEDLYNVMTFGFRGEALSSISSVSKFQICSKNIESNSGYVLEIIDGEKKDIFEIPQEQGTKIVIKELFYNTPARLNYIKKPRTEQMHIVEFLQAMSLSYPSVAFECIADGKKIFHYREGENLSTRIYNIYGKDFSENLLEVNIEMSGLVVIGFISDPKVSFGNNKKQNLFVNKRFIKSPLIIKSINNAYNRFIPHSRYAAYVLNIQVDPTQVDVNVHPRKMEVRFAQESSIFRGIYHAIQSKLDSVSLIHTSELNSQESTFGAVNTFSHNSGSQQEKKPEYYTGSGSKFKSYSPYKNTSPNPSQRKIGEAMNFSQNIVGTNCAAGIEGRRDVSVKDLENNALENNNEMFQRNISPGNIFDENISTGDISHTSLGRIIGQMHNSYIIIETREGMKILDQHALAERVIYERLVSQEHNKVVQGLLIGESISLTPAESIIIETHMNIFEEMGFEIEIMSHGIIMINAIPEFIKKDNISLIVEGVIADIGELGNKKSLTLEEVRNKIFAYVSCRSAVKFGHKLSLFEMNALVEDSVLDYSATCPHGRPVVFDMGLQELQDKYER